MNNDELNNLQQNGNTANVMQNNVSNNVQQNSNTTNVMQNNVQQNVSSMGSNENSFQGQTNMYQGLQQTTPVSNQTSAASQSVANNATDNLNKEDAMEEALSHTNQFTPFEEPKQEINTAENKGKFSFKFLIIIFIILFLFIFLLPKFATLFGWQY